MKNLLEADNVLIIPDKRIDLDLMAASISLSEVLIEAGKKVSLLVDNSNYPDIIERIFPKRGIEIFNLGLTKEYVLTLADQKAKVENIDWVQKKDRIQLIITTENGDIVQGRTKLERATGIFDQVIMIGAQEPKDLGEFYKKNDDLFEEKKVVKIKHTKDIEKQTRTSIFTNSLSENVFEFIEENKLKVNKYIATYLMTGIYWKTSGFTENIVSTKIFDNVKKLIDLGGDVQIAVKKALQNLKEEELKFISSIYNNTKIDDDGFALSVTDKQFENLNLNLLIFKQWDSIKYLQKAKLVVVIVQKDKLNSAFVFSNVKRLPVVEIIKEFNGMGSTEKGVFTSHLAPQEIFNKLKSKSQQLLGRKTSETRESKEEDKKIDKAKQEQSQVKSEPISEEKKLEREPSFMRQRKREQNEKPQKADMQGQNNKYQAANPKYQTTNNKVQNRSVDTIHPDRVQIPDTKSQIPDSNVENTTSSVQSSNVDPLAPAAELPKPLSLGSSKPQAEKPPVFSAPLPPVQK